MMWHPIDEPPELDGTPHTAIVFCADPENDWLMPGPVMWTVPEGGWRSEDTGELIEVQADVAYWWAYEDDIVNAAIAEIKKVGAGETAPCGREEALKQMIARLVDVMERSDAEQFGAEVEIVTVDEWFGAIEAAKGVLTPPHRPAGQSGHLRGRRPPVVGPAGLAGLVAVPGEGVTP